MFDVNKYLCRHLTVKFFTKVSLNLKESQEEKLNVPFLTMTHHDVHSL